MKKQFRKWSIRLMAVVVVFFGLLLTIVLNPVLCYASKTVVSGYTVYADKKVAPAFAIRLQEATVLLKTSALYDAGFKIDICLNDGSIYPEIMRTIKGQAFAWGFYNKVVVMGKVDAEKNTVDINGFHWNLSQLLAHEMVHCLQFHAFGLRHSNPIAGLPEWKWEGYPEYVGRGTLNVQELANNIARLYAVQHHPNNGWISLQDGTGTVITYYEAWLMVGYCLNVKGMSYPELLRDTTSASQVKEDMQSWSRGRSSVHSQ